MKKTYLFLAFFLAGSIFLAAQETTKKPFLQVGINASQLLEKLSQRSPIIPIRQNPYDIHLQFAPDAKISIRAGLGFDQPEPEADNGAVGPTKMVDYTVHTRIGMVWNFRFYDRWKLSSGPEIVYSFQKEKEYEETVLIRDRRTRFTALGAASNLQFALLPRLNIGVEMAIHVGVQVRERILSPFSDPNFPDFFFFDNTDPKMKTYAPVELFVYYSF